MDETKYYPDDWEDQEYWSEESENSWQLFRKHPQDRDCHPLQILKAPKKGTPYAEYWPNEEENKFIVDALNEKSKIISITSDFCTMNAYDFIKKYKK
jgi:hypothetical protein